MLRSKRDREALQKIHLKQPFEEFPHAPSVFLPSAIVKQSRETARALLESRNPDYRQSQHCKRRGDQAEEYPSAG
jgi:hypothetical protein